METTPKVEENKIVNKVVNIRPLFCIFIGLIIGGLFIYSYFVNNVVLLISIVILIITISICLILSAFLKRNIKNYFIIFALIIIFALVGGLLTYNSFKTYSSYPLKNDTYAVEGRIKQISGSENTITFVIENVNVNSKNYDFNIKVTTVKSAVDSSYIKVGNAISANMKLENVYLINNGKINSQLSMNNIKYTASLKNVILYKEGSKTNAEKFCEKISDVLQANISSEKAWLAYDILVGDKNGLQTDIYSLFQDCGLSHVLAVSGLHVGLIVAIFVFILKKLRLKKPYILLIMSFILILYCILCNYSPSVVRATIMAITYLVADCLGKRKDSLSVFSLAGIIILLIWPLHLFNVGFQLSFCAVFGIILLYKPLFNLFNKLHILSNISSSLSVTLSATIATFPVIAGSFGTISVGTIFANLIVLPIFTINYYILFIATLLGLIFNVSILFFFVENLFNIIFSLNGVFSSLGSITISNFNEISTILYLFGLFFFSQYVNPNLKYKNILCFCMAFVLLVSLCICNSTKQYNQNVIFANANIENCYLLTTKNNKNFLIGVGDNGQEYEFNRISQMLNYKNIFNLDKIIILNYDVKFQNNVVLLSKKYNVNQIVLNETNSQQDINMLKKLQKSDILVHNFKQKLKINNDIYVSGHILNSTYFAYNVNVKNKDYIILDKALTNARINYLNENCIDNKLLLYKDNLIKQINLSYNLVNFLHYSSDFKLKV